MSDNDLTEMEATIDGLELLSDAIAQNGYDMSDPNQRELASALVILLTGDDDD